MEKIDPIESLNQQFPIMDNSDNKKPEVGNFLADAGAGVLAELRKRLDVLMIEKKEGDSFGEKEIKAIKEIIDKKRSLESQESKNAYVGGSLNELNIIRLAIKEKFMGDKVGRVIYQMAPFLILALAAYQYESWGQNIINGQLASGDAFTTSSGVWVHPDSLRNAVNLDDPANWFSNDPMFKGGNMRQLGFMSGSVSLTLGLCRALFTDGDKILASTREKRLKEKQPDKN